MVHLGDSGWCWYHAGMNHCFRTLLAVFLLLAASTFAADETHPIKKLASAEADAEIALKEAREAAGKFERSYDSKRQKLNRQPDLTRRIVQDVLHLEEAKPDESRSPLLLEGCELANQSIDDLWSDQQASLQEADTGARKAQEQLNHLQEAFQAARHLAEQFKQSDMPLESVSAVFVSLTTEAKKTAEQLPKLEAELDKRMDDWAKQLTKTRESLDVK